MHLSLIIFIFIALAGFALGQECKSILTGDPQADALLVLVNPCARVVDYLYYLPSGVTVDYLETQVKTTLNNNMLRSISSSCQASLVEVTCASVYMKCQPDIVLGNISTYNNGIYGPTVPLPYVRPCTSVCTNLQTACLPTLLPLLMTLPNCAATYDYTFGQVPVLASSATKYDSSDLTCYAPLTAKVADASEEYLYTDTGGVCAGLVQNIYSLPGDMLDPRFAVVQEPYVVQGLIETQVKDKIDASPLWLKSSCYEALKKYICASGYLLPTSQTVRQVFVSNQLSTYLPTIAATYPGVLDMSLSHIALHEHTVCTDVVDQCVDLFERVKTANPPNCSAISSAGYPIFTDESHVFQSLEFPFGGTLLPVSVYTSSEPLVIEASKVPHYDPNCPAPFVYPDHPEDPRNQNIKGTGCAIPCMNPVYPKEDWDFLADGAQIIAIFAVICSILLFSCLLLEVYYFQSLLPFFSENFFVVPMLLYCFLSLFGAIVSLAAAGDHEKTWCYDNAINVDQSQGVSLCTFQGGTLVYTSIGSVIAICFVSFSTFRKLFHLKHVSDKTYVMILTAVTLITPMVPLIAAIESDLLGYSKQGPQCFILERPLVSKYASFYAVGIPWAICVTTSFICTVVNNIAAFIYNPPNRHSYVTNKVDPNIGNLATETGDKGGRIVPMEIGSDHETQSLSISYKDPHGVRQVVTSRTVYQIVLLSTLYFFMVSIIWGIWAIVRIDLLFFRYDIIYKNGQAWGDCVFKNYDGTDSWIGVCGRQPKDTLSTRMLLFINLCLVGHCIIVFAAYLCVCLVKWMVPSMYKHDDLGPSVSNLASMKTKVVPIATKEPLTNVTDTTAETNEFSMEDA